MFTVAVCSIPSLTKQDSLMLYTRHFFNYEIFWIPFECLTIKSTSLSSVMTNVPMCPQLRGVPWSIMYMYVYMHMYMYSCTCISTSKCMYY